MLHLHAVPDDWGRDLSHEIWLDGYQTAIEALRGSVRDCDAPAVQNLIAALADALQSLKPGLAGASDR